MSTDDQVERAVLSLLLAEGARGLAVAELVEQIGDRVAALRALDSLHAVGLAQWRGEHACPSPAAVRFDELGV